MQIAYISVDWEATQDALAEVGPGDLLEALEENDQIATWLEEPEIGDSANLLDALGMTATRLRRRLPAPSRARLDAFLKYVAPMYCDEHDDSLYLLVQDLALTGHDSIYASHAPETVRKVIESFRHVPFGDLYDAATAEGENLGDDGIESPESVVEYLKAWGRVFERAASSGRGLVFAVN